MKTLRHLTSFILLTILSTLSIYSQGVISRPTNTTKESKKAKKQSSYLYFAGNKTTTNIEFPFNGGNQTINVSSSASIQLHSNASWISASVSGSQIIIN